MRMFSRWPLPRFGFRHGRGEATAEHGARFRATILPHLDAAYTYARYLARDTVAAEDIVQEAFVRALRAMDSCRGSEKAWLMTIVRHCYHDWLRACRFDIPSGPAPDDDYEDPAAMEAIESHVTSGEVRILIERLPEPFREALVLRELQDMSYREIAQTTGAPLGTVMSRLARARGMLADLVLAPAGLLGDAPDQPMTREAKP